MARFAKHTTEQRVHHREDYALDADRRVPNEVLREISTERAGRSALSELIGWQLD